MLVILWEVLKFFIDELVIFFSELEWSLLKVIFSVSVVDKSTESTTLNLSHLEIILGKSLEDV